MAKFDRNFKIPAVHFDKDSIKKVAELICEGSDQMDDFFISLTDGEVTYESGDIESFFRLNLPDRADSLTFSALWRCGGNHPQRRIMLYFGKDFGFCSISSDGDEVWFRGKCEQIDNYLKVRAPWYSFFLDSFPHVTGVLVALLVLAGIYNFYHGAYYLMALCLVAIVLVEYLFKLYRDGRAFPRVSVSFRSSKGGKNYEAAIFLLTVAGVLGTFLGVVVNVYSAFSGSG